MAHFKGVYYKFWEYFVIFYLQKKLNWNIVFRFFTFVKRATLTVPLNKLHLKTLQLFN